MPAMKSQTSFLLAALAAAPALVSAHGHVVSISVNGKEFPGFQPGNPSADSVGWATTVTDNGFVLSSAANTADVICHRGATNAANSAPVNAGDSITIKWDTWPQSHVGPIIDYLASCNGDCSSVDKGSLEFFKINQGALLDGASNHWVTDDLITDGMTWTTTIPASLAPGSYVLRHEIIGLHEGNREGAAQLYPQCINIEVTGTGSEKPAGVVGTSLYTATDPGIFFDVYKGAKEYPIPGPALAFGAGGGNGGSNPAPAPAPAPSTPASNPPANGGGSSAPAPTTLATATSAAQPAPTKPANGGGNSQGAALYAQCGGQGFTGATSCAEGSCVKQNDYYSQCVPK